MQRDTAEKNFFTRKRNNHPCADLSGNTSTALDLDGEVSRLCACIQVIDQKKIRNFFLELEDKFFSSGKSAREIRHECITLMVEARCNLKNRFPAIKETLESGGEILDAIIQLPTLEEITDAMLKSSLGMSESISFLSSEGSFRRIIGYVRDNYNEDLRLENLGKLFGYNSAYLGRCFKKYAGKCFNTYLDMVRIDAAKELLKSSNMKVYEISTAVGFGNADYFHEKFKKYTGESPLFFRSK